MAGIPSYKVEVSKDAALIVFIIIQCIYTLILCPITIYYTKQLWKLHKDKILFITKRRPQSVIFGIVLLNFYPIIVRPLSDLPSIYPSLNFYINDRKHVQIVLTDVALFILLALFCRVWLLYYDYERCIHSIRIQWQNPIKIKSENYTPWTLKHKTLGNTFMIFVITVIAWLIAMIIILLINFLNIFISTIAHF